MRSLTWTFGQQPFLSSVLLSPGFQCIHVAGELSFSSKNKLLWEFLVHSVSFSHTTSCLIIVNLLTIDSGRILFSQQRKLYQSHRRYCVKKPSIQDCFLAKYKALKKWIFFHSDQLSSAEL